MQNHITRRDAEASRNYVSFVEDYAPPPPPLQESPQQHIVSDGTLGHIALGANILITVIIVVAMMVDGSQARTAIIVGGIYFTLTTAGFAFVTTGALTAIVNAYQRERTERQRVAAYRELGALALHWRIEVERTRRQEIMPAPPERTPSAEGMHRVSPLEQASTFVTPYVDDERAALEAIRWAEKLYDPTGLGAPDPRKVQVGGDSIGRLKVRMIGSKRGRGSREAGVWLLRQGVIRKVAGGYALALEQFPYRHYLSSLLPD